MLWMTAQAEEAVVGALDLSALQEYAQEQSFDFSQSLSGLISGQGNLLSDLPELLDQSVRQAIGGVRGILTAVLVPMAVLAALRMILPGGDSARSTAALLCRISCIPALSAAFLRVQGQAEQLLQSIAECSQFLSPALIAAVSLSGAESTAAIMSPMAGVCVQLIEELLAKWGSALCAAAAGIAVAGSLSTAVRLNRLHRLIRQTLHWCSGGLLAAFMAVLSIQGRLGSGRDTAASRTAHYAIENLIPVVGGNVSESLDSLLSSAQIVKNALGASGLMLLVSICAAPMLQMLVLVLALRLTAAIGEPLGDEVFSTLTSQFADSVEMLLIVSVTAAVLCALLAGSCMAAATNIVR